MNEFFRSFGIRSCGVLMNVGQKGGAISGPFIDGSMTDRKEGDVLRMDDCVII